MRWLVLIFLITTNACRPDTETEPPGTLLWEKTIEDDGDIHGEWITFDKDNNAVVAVGGGSVWYYDKDGNLLWSDEGQDAVWVDTKGNINTLTSVFDKEGNELADYSNLELPSVYRFSVDSQDGIILTRGTSGIEKFNEQRQSLWELNLNIPWGSQKKLDVVIDSQRNITVVGVKFFDWMDGVDFPQGMVIGRFNHEGESIETTGIDKGFSVSNLVITLDCHDGLLILDPKTLPVEQLQDDKWSLSKYDQQNEIEWTKDFADTLTGPVSITSMTCDDECNIIMTGSIIGRVPEVSEDIWVGKYDQELNEIWSTTVVGSGKEDDQGSVVTVDTDGNILVTGVQNVELKILLPPGGPTDGPTKMWIGKLSR